MKIYDEPGCRPWIMQSINQERKVRAPQGMMPGNTRAKSRKRLFDRKRNRKYTSDIGFSNNGKGEMAG